MEKNVVKYQVMVNGKSYEVPEGATYLDLSRECSVSGAILAKTNNRLVELQTAIRSDGDVCFLDGTDKDGRRAYRRSVVFLMQRALLDVAGDVDIVIDHSLGQGYYCHIDGLTIDEDFLSRLKAGMQSLVDADLPLQKTSMKTSEARALFRSRGMKDKERLLRYRTSSNTNVYELDGCIDYFYGYMAPSTGVLGVFDLLKYQQGFMILFPAGDLTQVAPFTPADKLFTVLQASEKWGEDMEIPTVGALNDAICAGKTRDIILTQEAFMERRIGALAEEIASDPNRKFIMIAGPSSSGKTTFSHRLSAQLRALGVTPHPIPLDDYYLGRDKIPVDEFGKKDFESIEGLDIDLFNENMVELLHGKRVLLPSYNFRTGVREYKDHYMQIGDHDVLVIEGIHGLNDRMSASLPQESKFKIYISALTQLNIDEHNPLSTSDGRLIRRIVRDARTRGTEAKDTIAMWDSVRRGEEKNIFPFQEQADEMFNSALIYEMAVLKTYAQPQLFAIPPDCEEYAEAKRLLKLLDYFLNIPSEDIGNNSLIREFIGGSCLPV